jgi:hypothetical protein
MARDMHRMASGVAPPEDARVDDRDATTATCPGIIAATRTTSAGTAIAVVLRRCVMALPRRRSAGAPCIKLAQQRPVVSRCTVRHLHDATGWLIGSVVSQQRMAYNGAAAFPSTKETRMIAPRRPFAMLMTLSALGVLLAMCGAPSAVPDDAPVAPPTATPAPEAEYVAVPAGDGVAAFRVGRTEVTNAQYAQCVAAGACTVPGTYDGGGCHYNSPAYAEHPVVCVTREQARAYATWAGGSLLTEAQWTRACQGDDGRTYPWGEAAPDASRANYGWDTDLTNDATMPVGMFPADTSPYSLLDMAGNAAEDVESDDGDEQRSIVRGGAYYVIPENITCAARIEYGTDGSSRDVGFRVALSGD